MLHNGSCIQFHALTNPTHYFTRLTVGSYHRNSSVLKTLEHFHLARVTLSWPTQINPLFFLLCWWFLSMPRYFSSEIHFSHGLRVIALMKCPPGIAGSQINCNSDVSAILDIMNTFPIDIGQCIINSSLKNPMHAFLYAVHWIIAVSTASSQLSNRWSPFVSSVRLNASSQKII